MVKCNEFVIMSFAFYVMLCRTLVGTHLSPMQNTLVNIAMNSQHTGVFCMDHMSIQKVFVLV